MDQGDVGARGRWGGLRSAAGRGLQSGARVRAAVEAVAVARQALQALHPEDLTALADSELTGLLTAVDHLAGHTTVVRADLVGEAISRRILASSQFDDTAWVARHCPTLATGGARQVLTLSAVLGDEDLLPVTDAIRTLTLSPAAAITISREYTTLRPHLADHAQAAVLDQMVALGSAHGPRVIHQFRDHLLARYGAPGEFQDHQDTARVDTELSIPVRDNSVYRYTLTLDPEAHAVLEAAIGPLSAPQPAPDGTRDPRSVGQRRGQALIDLCRRTTTLPHHPGTAKTTLYVTIDYQQLAGRTGAGTTLGATTSGNLLAPDTIRKLACDAQVIPAVLGSDGQILNYGRAVRLFTRAQIRYLWLRDRNCTFDGCQIPAQWCDAHHLIHWADGGPTNADNAALLCGRHHTIVHRDQLAGHLTDGHILWDRKPGSYQQLRHAHETAA